ATARSGDSDDVVITARARKPSCVVFTPGVPDSMKSCASKCERVASGEPTACTNAAEWSLKYGSTEARAGWTPKKPSRSSAPDLATARSGDSDDVVITARARKPSCVVFTPGVPDSMKSCASKCERVASSEPTACTNAAEWSLKYGSTEARAGWTPKKPSRSSAPPSAPGRGTAIVGRAA